MTPADWECLDGTLFFEEQGAAWMVFCHEWLQIRDGTICAVRLSQDLRQAIGEPVHLFNGSDAAWARPLQLGNPTPNDPPNYVTDGPFLYRLADGTLLML